MNPEDTQHEVEEMVERVKELHDEDITAEFARELEGVEEAMAVEVGNETQLSAEIRASRADLCTQQGFEAHEVKNCEVFMTATCSPIATGFGVPTTFCDAFFGRAPLKLHALRGASKGPAPSPGAAPGPAPGPALFGGKRVRLLPEQGLSGKLIMHKDFETMAEDWMTEREGAGASEICKRHPENEWCRLHFSGSMPGDAANGESQEAREAHQASEGAGADAEAGGSDASGADASGADGAQPATPEQQGTPRKKSTEDHLRTASGSVTDSLKDILKIPNPFRSSSSRTHVIGALAALFLGQLLH